MLRKRLWSQPQPSDPASEAPQWGLEICHFLQHQMILEAIKLLEPLPRRKHTLGNGNATTEYIPVFKPVFKHGYGCYKKQNIHLIVEKKKTWWYIDCCLSSSICLAWRQLQTRSRWFRGTVTVQPHQPWALLLFMVKYIPMFSCHVYFWETTCIAFTRRCQCASGAGEGESNFITVKCLPPITLQYSVTWYIVGL